MHKAIAIEAYMENHFTFYSITAPKRRKLI